MFELAIEFLEALFELGVVVGEVGVSFGVVFGVGVAVLGGIGWVAKRAMGLAKKLGMDKEEE